ncbi:MAG: GNAT family N-acetyltransferase [Muribaculaceae bacterium]|nr:GNAT family N-acetyltransferase [Muribaculaceae bacterium]
MNDDMVFRPSCCDDLERIMPVYENAVKFMRCNGNLKQWTGGYPSRDIINNDIRNGNHFMAEDKEGNVLAVFSFIIGEDPTYAEIEDGNWLNNLPYGTIHRIASSGLRSRMLEECVGFCFSRIDNLRIDTHADNAPMLNAISRLGFTRCGIIHLSDGAPRVAFHKYI